MELAFVVMCHWEHLLGKDNRARSPQNGVSPKVSLQGHLALLWTTIWFRGDYALSVNPYNGETIYTWKLFYGGKVYTLNSYNVHGISNVALLLRYLIDT